MNKKLLPVLWLSIIAFAGSANGFPVEIAKKNMAKDLIGDTTNAGLKLPQGFTAIKAADHIGQVRHIVVTPQGTLYAKSFRTVNGKGIFVLKDLKGNGTYEVVSTFDKFAGTGIAIKKGYLYASSDEEVFRYKLDAKNEVINTDAPEKIITGLINRHQHETKSIALDNEGNIYVNIGGYANACQESDRQKGSKGIMPCPILDSSGGIWVFKANKLNQTYGDGTRYATGLRNVVGLDWNQQTNSLFVMQHGRDQLYGNWPEYFDSKAGAELPSECMYELHKGSNCGWPYIYYNHLLHKKILAPEYGGDGKKEGSSEYQDPVLAFPGHLAPNGLLFYTGNQFPEKYKNGAFIAFHGSWNRSPLPQAGYFVVFAPFKNGKPTGEWEVFADGFSGKEVVTSTRGAEHRPCGLAQGPDGSLYVSDDSKGTIYKINYKK
ncbi:PQQ-dependent sugar dehydrogenase [Parasediminibacterium sp. JCM 36343]|uniref:PQQ-dependent sugar dehydrogenase n=1 Tax=Parasediminibacterium sp. JCM 36343 TaxID=3374279 RepID=UPI00397C9F9F